jgi:putative transposase
MTRESPAIEVDGSLSGQRVVAVLKRLGGAHGLPKILFVDNGPEFTSKALDAWAHQHGVKLAFSRPGTPTDNPFIEAFNARFREECLNQHWFVSLEEARTTIEAWRVDYNTERPHTALHC